MQGGYQKLPWRKSQPLECWRKAAPVPLLRNTPSALLCSSLLFDSCLWPSSLCPVLFAWPCLEVFKHRVLYDFSLGDAGPFQHLFYPVLPGSGCQSRDVALREWDGSWEDKSPGRCQEQSQACAWGLLEGGKPSPVGDKSWLDNCESRSRWACPGACGTGSAAFGTPGCSLPCLLPWLWLSWGWPVFLATAASLSLFPVPPWQQTFFPLP